MEENEINNTNTKKDESGQQNMSGNMYSYRDNNNKNVIDNPQEAGAIRRSMGEGNPNINIIQNNIGGGYGQNYINNGDVGNHYSQENYYNSNKNSDFWVTYSILGCIEVLIIIILAFFFENKNITYNYNNKNITNEASIDETIKNEIIDETFKNETFNETFDYGLLRDMNIMVFIGFGMLHSILRRSSWISISINMLILSFSIQLSLFFNFLWKNAFKDKSEWEESFDFLYLMKAIFTSSSVLITLGSVLGKLSIIQYVIMAIFETILSSLNYQLCEEKLKIYDYGGSLYIHTFGAIFAIAVSTVLFCSSKVKLAFQNNNHLNKSNYFSNLTTFLGIIILLCFFPSFNSALAEIELRKIGRINTYYSLLGSVMGSFITSGLYNRGRFVFEQVFLGSISGAIIISGCCTICYNHWAPIIIGTLGTIIIVTFLSKIKPFFLKWGLQDTLNIIILHGISGLLGAFITPIFAANGGEFDKQFNATLSDIVSNEREYTTQAGIQIGAIFITIGISFIGGIATGYLMKISICGKISQYFTDAEFFHEEENNIFEYVEPNTVYNVEINNPSLFKMEYPVYNNPKIKGPDMRGSQPSY